MGQVNKPYKRERIPASKLELNMLEYQLKEARQKLEEKTEESERLSALLKRNQETLDYHIQRQNRMISINVKLSKKVALYKMVSIVEAVIIVLTILSLLGVV